MAFPTSPSDNDEYTNANGTSYKYDSGDDKWVIITNLPTIETGAAFPANPIEGTIFYHTGDETTYVYDATATAWIQLGGAGSSAISDIAYAASWDAVTNVAPSKNAVYDIMNDHSSLHIVQGTYTGNNANSRQILSDLDFDVKWCYIYTESYYMFLKYETFTGLGLHEAVRIDTAGNYGMGYSAVRIDLNWLVVGGTTGSYYANVSPRVYHYVVMG